MDRQLNRIYFAKPTVKAAVPRDEQAASIYILSISVHLCLETPTLIASLELYHLIFYAKFVSPSASKVSYRLSVILPQVTRQ